MKKIKKIAAVTIAVSGLAMAGAGVASASSADAQGRSIESPGVGSGNLVQVPVNALSVNACGNSASVVGALNPAFGNFCINH